MKKLTGYAKKNRKNPTPAECYFRKMLQRWHIKFRAQRPIDRYIVDFLIPERWLIIELDGPYHDFQQAYDRRRDAYIRSKGYSLIRFKNEVALNSPQTIRDAIFTFPKRPAPDDWRKLYGMAMY